MFDSRVVNNNHIRQVPSKQTKVLVINDLYILFHICIKKTVISILEVENDRHKSTTTPQPQPAIVLDV